VTGREAGHEDGPFSVPQDEGYNTGFRVVNNGEHHACSRYGSLALYVKKVIAYPDSLTSGQVFHLQLNGTLCSSYMVECAEVSCERLEILGSRGIWNSLRLSAIFHLLGLPNCSTDSRPVMYEVLIYILLLFKSSSFNHYSSPHHSRLCSPWVYHTSRSDHPPVTCFLDQGTVSLPALRHAQHVADVVRSHMKRNGSDGC
jgi:hypothetical protein